MSRTPSRSVKSLASFTSTQEPKQAASRSVLDSHSTHFVGSSNRASAPSVQENSLNTKDVSEGKKRKTKSQKKKPAAGGVNFLPATTLIEQLSDQKVHSDGNNCTVSIISPVSSTKKGKTRKKAKKSGDPSDPPSGNAQHTATAIAPTGALSVLASAPASSKSPTSVTILADDALSKNTAEVDPTPIMFSSSLSNEDNIKDKNIHTATQKHRKKNKPTPSKETTGEGSEPNVSHESEENAKLASAQRILDAIRASANSTSEEGQVPIQKDFLLNQSSLSPEACTALRQKLGIEVTPDTAPPPVESNEDPVLPKVFATFMSRSKLPTPSAIQAQAWTAVLSGKDVIALGATGSGKTIAYLLPVVPHILANRQQGFISALVLVPTRELAIQVSTVARTFRSLFGVSCYTVYGGADKAEQEEYLAKVGAVDVLVATPGRLCDLLICSKLSLAHVSYLVLDEADKMLEGSLGEQVSGLVGLCRTGAQRLVFSATLPEHIRATVNAFVQPSCVQVKVQESEGTTTLGAHIKQTLHVTSDAHHKKLRKLLRTLIQINAEHSTANPQAARNQRPSVMIFVNKIKTIPSVMGCLQKANRVVGISRGLSGNMRQSEREEVISGFRAGKFHNLVTTDLAGRGMDIKRLNYVVNFDFPPTISQYIHRVGRAGRQGQASSTFTFFTRNRKGLAPHILKILQQTNQWEDPNLLLLCKEIEEGHEEDEGAEGDDDQDQIEPTEHDDLPQKISKAQKKKERAPHKVPSKSAKRKSSGDPYAIPSWLSQSRTIVPDSSGSECDA